MKILILVICVFMMAACDRQISINEAQRLANKQIEVVARRYKLNIENYTCDLPNEADRNGNLHFIWTSKKDSGKKIYVIISSDGSADWTASEAFFAGEVNPGKSTKAR